MSTNTNRQNQSGIGAAIVVLFCIGGCIIGALLLFWGLITIGAGMEGIDELKLYTGKLQVITPAKDEALGLTDMGPLIKRTTEMYQYTEESVTIGKNNKKGYIMKEAFSANAEGDIETYATEEDARKGDGNKKTYHNPAFPKAFLSENNTGYCVLFGDVEIGDEGVKLGTDLIEKYFINDQQSLFEESKYLVPAYNDPKDAGKSYHLLHTGKGKYASRKDQHWKIGDLKVTYTVIDPKELEGEFTAIGALSKDHTLTMDSGWGKIYKGKVSMEEASRQYKDSNYKSGLIFSLVGFLFIFIGIVITVLVLRRR